MSAIGRFLGLLLALFGLVLPAAGAGQGREEAQGPEVPVYLFWSASCPHCLAARPQIQALAAAHPWIVLHDLELGADPAHGERYEAMAAELGEEALAVPALFYCGRMEVGWDAGGGSAARLLEALEACRGGQRPPVAAPALRLPLLGEVDAARLSLPVLTLLVAGMDAFNPCAFFVLLFLLSLLVQSFAAVRGYLKLRENALKSDLYRHMATMDTMTGLENRNAYNDLALQMADSPTPGWVAVMDLNRLKVINDTLGHKSGDALLLSFAQHMRAVSASLRDSRLYRIGGDEFLLFTREPADFPMARWLQQQRDAWAHNPTPAHTSAADFAFGAQYWAGDSSFESAVMLADGKMYEDKQARRG